MPLADDIRDVISRVTRDVLTSQLDSLQEKISKQVESELKPIVSAATKAQSEAESRAEEAEARADKALLEAAKAKEKVEEISEELKAAKAEVKATKAEEKEHEEAAEARADKALLEAAKAKEKLEEANEHLAEAKAEAKAARSEAKEATEALESAKEELASVKEELAAAKKEVHAAIKRIEELESSAKSGSAAPLDAPPTATLEASIASLYEVNAQADILRTLLDGCSKFSSRSALFVIKAGTASGWQARGFEDADQIKSVKIDTGKGLAARALQDRQAVAAAAAEFSSEFVGKFGNPADGNCSVLPLVVRDKVPAFVYADGGAEKSIDTSALQTLVRAGGMWLETLALRKSGGTAEAEAPAEAPAAMAAAAAAPEAAPAKAATPAPAAGLSSEDEEVHKKAKRFAKLLVDEIKLYNQAKVNEGRQNKDLFERLREDIEKSRATYDKRYGATVAASANYFNQEVVRILADNDASLMGAGFNQ